MPAQPPAGRGDEPSPTDSPPRDDPGSARGIRDRRFADAVRCPTAATAAAFAAPTAATAAACAAPSTHSRCARCPHCGHGRCVRWGGCCGRQRYAAVRGGLRMRPIGVAGRFAPDRRHHGHDITADTRHTAAWIRRFRGVATHYLPDYQRLAPRLDSDTERAG